MPNNSKLQHSPTRNTLSCTLSGSLPGPLGLSDHDLIFTVWKMRIQGQSRALDQHVLLRKKVDSWRLAAINITWFAVRNFAPKQIVQAPQATSFLYFLEDYKRQCYKVTSLKRNFLKKFRCDAFLNAKHPEEFFPLVLVKAYIASSSLKSVVLFPTLSL